MSQAVWALGVERNPEIALEFQVSNLFTAGWAGLGADLKFDKIT